MATSEKNGKVSGWQDAKGFGFILPDDGSARVFLHHSALAPDQARPSNGDAVRYIQGADDKGRAVAKKVWTRSQAELTQQRRERVRAAEKVVKEQESREKDSQAIWLVAPFLTGLLVLVWLKRIPLEIGGVYLVISLITFVMYWNDKRAARTGAWRTRESTLHVLSLLGGWPGALLAQRTLRHKSSKNEFRIVFWASVVVNLILLITLAAKVM